MANVLKILSIRNRKSFSLRCSRILLSLGYAKAMLAVTGFSIATSVILVSVMLWVMNSAPHIYFSGLIMAVIVPALVAPMATHLMMRVLFQLDSAQKELIELATRDSLTKVFNRRFFMEQFGLLAAQAERAKQPLSLLLIDADEFKKINDRFGHLTGDKVLIAIANACAETIRSGDVLARFGGEEFIALLPNTSAELARDIAERVRLAMSTIVVYDNNQAPIKITVSIGFNTKYSSTQTIEALIEGADFALYNAKRTGRNCVVFNGDIEGRGTALEFSAA